MDPVKFFKCLADDTRLKLILLIQQSGELCVCDLIQALDLSQPKISRHLAQLRKCQVLQDCRRGKWVYYQLHSQLPQWATEVIAQTAQQNASYLSEHLKRLSQLQTTTQRCTS